MLFLIPHPFLGHPCSLNQTSCGEHFQLERRVLAARVVVDGRAPIALSSDALIAEHAGVVDVTPLGAPARLPRLKPATVIALDLLGEVRAARVVRIRRSLNAQVAHVSDVVVAHGFPARGGAALGALARAGDLERAGTALQSRRAVLGASVAEVSV